MFELAQMEDDTGTLEALSVDVEALDEEVGQMGFAACSPILDPQPCFWIFRPVRAVPEACDWASMLLRQYVRYCERKDFKVEILEESPGTLRALNLRA